MAGQTMAGSFSYSANLPTIYAHLVCILVAKLNSGRLAVYSCGHVKQHMGTYRFIPV